MYFKFLFISLALAISCLPLTNAHADNQGSTIHIAVIDDIPSTTMAVRLLEAAYARLGLSMKTLVSPSRRALLMADTGQLDGDLFRIEAVASDYPNLLKVDYPLLEGGLYAVIRNPHAQKLPEPSDKPLKVAVRRGVIIAEKTAEALGMEPVHTESYEQIRTLLEWGRVDLALVSDIEGLPPLATGDWSQFSILPEPVTRFTLHHYLNRKHASLAEKLADELAEMDKEGLKARLRKLTLSEQKDGEW